MSYLVYESYEGEKNSLSIYRIVRTKDNRSCYNFCAKF